MDYNKIKTLLDKYFEGKTSLSEENLLSEYFNQTYDIHPDFEYAKDMFQYFKKESGICCEENSGKQRLLGINGSHKVRILIAVAAGFLLIFITTLFFPIIEPDKKAYAYINGEPVYDSDIALYEAQDAIYKLTHNFNTGTENLSNLSKFYEIEKKLSKSK